MSMVLKQSVTKKISYSDIEDGPVRIDLDTPMDSDIYVVCHSLKESEKDLHFEGVQERKKDHFIASFADWSGIYGRKKDDFVEFEFRLYQKG